MPAHRFFGEGAAALRDKMTVFQSNRLLIEAGITDDRRRDMRFVRLDNADTIFGEVLGT
jgi:hypothetical protein